MPSYTIISSNMGGWRVHLTGCRDIQKDVRQYAIQKPFVREAENIAGLIKAEIESLDESFGCPSGYDASCFEILPCAQEAK